MREIKFRAPLKFSDGFVLMMYEITVHPNNMIGFSYENIKESLPKEYEIVDDNIEKNLEPVFSLLAGDEWFWVENIEPEMHTGLKDRTGKEIYEGDVVEYSNRIGKIVWHEYQASFDLEYIKIIEGRVYIKFEGIKNNQWSYYLEIIGNIHENPELIK